MGTFWTKISSGYTSQGRERGERSVGAFFFSCNPDRILLSVLCAAWTGIPNRTRGVDTTLI